MVRDTENIITTSKISRSVTATAIMPEENLHRILPPLQKKCASCVSPTDIGLIILNSKKSRKSRKSNKSK